MRSDLKWSSNTLHMTGKAYQRLWILRRLKNLRAEVPDLKEVYIKQIRPLIEYAVPVWGSSITRNEILDIERVQKSALKIIIQEKYKSYTNSLTQLT